MYRLMAVLVLLAGCRGAPVRVAIPQADQVDLLQVQRNEGEDRPTHQILERERIDVFLTLIQRITAEERKFEHNWYTYPNSAFTVAAKCRGDAVAAFWVSPGHVGGRSPLEEDRFLQPISDDEWRQIAAILGIPADDGP